MISPMRIDRSAGRAAIAAISTSARVAIDKTQAPPYPSLEIIPMTPRANSAAYWEIAVPKNQLERLIDRKTTTSNGVASCSSPALRLFMPLGGGFKSGTFVFLPIPHSRRGVALAGRN